jgi:hypothetical protein
MKTKTLIRRPSRYQQNKAGYELTLSGLCMGRAIVAVQNAEDAYTDIGAAMQEGALMISPDTWDVVSSRYAKARRKLNACRQKVAAGQTCAKRSC